MQERRAIRTSLVVLALASLLAPACGGTIDQAEGPEAGGEAQAQVLGGFVNWGAPEVGTLVGRVMCTGTLISPKVVLTAAHCVDGGISSFRVHDGAGRVRASYAIVDRWRSPRANGASIYDVALVKLAANVPDWVARPRDITDQAPATGTAMAIWGFGCTSWGTGEGAGVKRVGFWTYGQGHFTLCPGDSGGPSVNFRNGLITHVNSGVRFQGLVGQDILAPLSLQFKDIQFVRFIFQIS